MGLIDVINSKIPCLLSRRTAFLSMTLLLGVFFIVELVTGYITNSMALIADSFHMLSDVASLIVGYLALKYSTQDAPKERYTYGYVRAEVLGALVNAVFLVALCFSILIEALKRLVILEPIENPLLVFIVGAVGLVVNAFGLFLFHQAGYEAHGHSHGGGGHGHSHGGGGHGHSHGGSGHGHSHGGSGHGHSHGGGGHGHSHGGGGHGHSHGGDGSKHGQIHKQDESGAADSHIQGGDSKQENKPSNGEHSHADGFELGRSDSGKRSKAHLIGTKKTKAEENLIHIEKADDVLSDERRCLLANEGKSSEEGKCTQDHPSFDSSAPESLDALERQRIPKPRSASQLNITGVYLHILGDALGSVIVMISALIILFAKGRWTLYVDPAMSIIMVIIILKTSIPLLSETAQILMNSVPSHIQVKDLEQRLKEQIPGVKDVHELHVWQLAGDKVIASAHVKFSPTEDMNAAAAEIKEFFHAAGIHSTTVQIEFERDEDNPLNISRCMLLCSLDDGCEEMMCCKPLR